MSMRIGSLFSGVGGLELGLEWSGLGHTVWQVEKDAYRRSVLAKHWPHAERFDDVSKVGRATLARVDVICGGFPCQDVSSAGKRAGLAGARSSLWSEYRRVVAELRPAWVVVENVTSGAGTWVDTVRRDLAKHGYATLPLTIAASDVGAPHRRGRVFIVGTNANAQSKPARAVHAAMGRAQATAADADGESLRHESRRASGPRRADATIAQYAGWRAAQPDMVRMVHGVPARLDRPGRRRTALGDAVVPQCAQVVGEIIQLLGA